MHAKENVFLSLRYACFACAQSHSSPPILPLYSRIWAYLWKLMHHPSCAQDQRRGFLKQGMPLARLTWGAHAACQAGLGWAVIDTMVVGMYLLALKRAWARAACRVHELFSTDQGSKFTNAKWTRRLQA